MIFAPKEPTAARGSSSTYWQSSPTNLPIYQKQTEVTLPNAIEGHYNLSQPFLAMKEHSLAKLPAGTVNVHEHEPARGDGQRSNPRGAMNANRRHH